MNGKGYFSYTTGGPMWNARASYFSKSKDLPLSLIFFFTILYKNPYKKSMTYHESNFAFHLQIEHTKIQQLFFRFRKELNREWHVHFKIILMKKISIL